MATASPALKNNSNIAIMSAATAPSKATTLAAAANLGNHTDAHSKSQRGHKKPKCRMCGDVPRSRCPYESCKSYCSRNQNPCHIHGLLVELHHLDNFPTVFPSSITCTSLQSRKPLTRKDAAAINEWRFFKLKEYKERNIELENEAFDQYMRNVDLLKEVLSVKSMEDNVSTVSELIKLQWRTTMSQ